MRIGIVCILAAFALSSPAFAQEHARDDRAAPSVPPGYAAAEPKLADMLEANVRAAWQAFKNRDKAGYAKFLAENFQAVEADGNGERPASHILLEVERSMYTDYLLQLFQVQQLGSNYAFLTYESTMQFPQGSATRFRRVFVGELWTRREGEWKLMRYQETPVR